MPQEFSRTRRIGEQIRRDLAQLIRDELRDDPRMTMVSITGVEATRDLSFAKVYVTLLGDSEDRPKIVARLNQASPHLRHELGRTMHIRAVPKLEFIYDETVENGARLYDLITNAVADDNHRHPHDNPEEKESG